MVVFGARPDSDYDVTVFFKDLARLGEEMGRIAEIETDILYDTGAAINALPLQAGSYRERTGLCRNRGAKASTSDAGGRPLSRQSAERYQERVALNARSFLF